MGNKQKYCLDYDEIFAPVAKMTTIRTLVAISAAKSWSSLQMDIKNVFLYGDLEKTVFMWIHLRTWCPLVLCLSFSTLFMPLNKRLMLGLRKFTQPSFNLVSGKAAQITHYLYDEHQRASQYSYSMWMISLYLVMIAIGYTHYNRLFNHILIWKTLVLWLTFLVWKWITPTVTQRREGRRANGVISKPKA